jgi:hypothetical protein
MVLSRSLRRIVAFAAATLFLACQTTAFVYARSADVLQPGGISAQGPCHDSEQQSDQTSRDNVCQANCLSQLTSSGAGVFAATDLPAITTRTDRIVAVAHLASPAEPPLLLVEPPPLAILHCCLRN